MINLGPWFCDFSKDRKDLWNGNHGNTSHVVPFKLAFQTWIQTCNLLLQVASPMLYQLNYFGSPVTLQYGYTVKPGDKDHIHLGPKTCGLRLQVVFISRLFNKGYEGIVLTKCGLRRPGVFVSRFHCIYT